MSDRRRLSSLPVFLLPRRHLGELSFRWDINLHLLRDSLSVFTRGSPPLRSRCTPPPSGARPLPGGPSHRRAPCRGSTRDNGEDPGVNLGQSERVAEARRELEVKVNMDLNYSPAWAGAPEGPGTHPWRFRLFAGGERGIRPRRQAFPEATKHTRACPLSNSRQSSSCFPSPDPSSFTAVKSSAISPLPSALLRSPL